MQPLPAQRTTRAKPVEKQASLQSVGDLRSYVSWARRHKGLAESTIADYAYKIQRATEDIPKLATASVEDLLHHYDGLKPTAPTRRNARSALASYFEYQIDCGCRRDNPALSLPVWKIRRGVPNPYEPTEARALIEACYGYSPMMGCIAVVLFYSGLRRTELVERRWQDYRGRGLRLTGKGGYVDIQPLNVVTVDAIEAWRPECRSVKWMFPSPVDPIRHVGGEWIYRKIHQIGESIGIDGVKLHRFRHTFGTAILEATGDLTIAQEALRHRNIQNTQIYARVVKTRVAEATEHLHF